MTVLAYATGSFACQLLGTVDRLAPAHWSRTQRETEQGVICWSGPDVFVDDDIVVVGRPSRDPWGWPGETADLDELALLFKRYGGPAIEAVSGPRLVVDLRNLHPYPASNGLIPFYDVRSETGAIGSTSRAVLERLVGTGARISRRLPDSAARSRDKRTHLVGRRVREELLQHRPIAPVPTGEMSAVPPRRDDFWAADTRAINRIRNLAENLMPAYWWNQRLRDRWLFAPCMERPVIDRLLEMTP